MRVVSEGQNGSIVGTHAVTGEPQQEIPVVTKSTLTLSECLRVACEKQPKVVAQRASLAMAQAAERALERLRIPVSLSAQIPHRRQQAALAVIAASAALDQIERETAYAVTRTYLTIQLARDQERLAQTVIELLNAAKSTSERALDLGVREITAADVMQVTFYLRLAETRHVQAMQGIKRAQVALREAMGLGPEYEIDIPAGGLPEATVQPQREAVLAAALKRRGELIQARMLAQITCVEADAQASTLSQRVETYAAGFDIHSTQIPQGSNGGEYRPASVPPEMPTLLLGTRKERIKQVQALIVRAESLAESTRNLITLEVEDAFLRWEETSQQARKTGDAADTGDKLADAYRKELTAGLKVSLEKVVTTRMLTAQTRAEHNEFRFRTLVALADLERATAGGFSAGLVERK